MTVILMSTRCLSTILLSANSKFAAVRTALSSWVKPKTNGKTREAHVQCDCSEEFLQQLLAVVIVVGIPIDVTRGHFLLLPVDADLPQEVVQFLYVGCPFASALEL